MTFRGLEIIVGNHFYMVNPKGHSVDCISNICQYCDYSGVLTIAPRSGCLWYVRGVI